MPHPRELPQGSRMTYLNRRRKLGMPMFLCKISLENTKNERLGSLSLCHGKVMGFDLY